MSERKAAPARADKLWAMYPEHDAMARKPALAYLIADGARARLVLRHGDGRYEALAHFANPIREQRPSGPVRRTAGASARPSQVAAFAADLVASVSGFTEQGLLERLVLVAPPRLLAALQQRLPLTLADRVVGQLQRDFTKLPEKNLERLLDELLFHGPGL